LRDIVRSELELFSSQTSIEGPDLKLNPQAAQNLVLAVHELSTNAAKYGALSKPGGNVAISWSVQGRDETGVLI
jgi:two-component sensor histidine kinase